MLGVVGDERAVEALIAFVAKPVESERLSINHADAYSSAIQALGVLVYHTGSERALTYLIEGLTPGVWRQRNIPGMPVYARSHEEYDRQLSNYALFGLALSGHPRARDALQSLLRAQTAGRAEFREGLDATLVQWLEVALVAERGLGGMYEYYEAERIAHPERGQP